MRMGYAWQQLGLKFPRFGSFGQFRLYILSLQQQGLCTFFNEWRQMIQ